MQRGRPRLSPVGVTAGRHIIVSIDCALDRTSQSRIGNENSSKQSPFQATAPSLSYLPSSVAFDQARISLARLVIGIVEGVLFILFVFFPGQLVVFVVEVIVFFIVILVFVVKVVFILVFEFRVIQFFIHIRVNFVVSFRKHAVGVSHR